MIKLSHSLMFCRTDCGKLEVTPLGTSYRITYDAVDSPTSTFAGASQCPAAAVVALSTLDQSVTNLTQFRILLQ